MSLMEQFRDGGWGMYPTLVFGLVLLGVSVRYAWKPENRVVPLMISLGITTLVAGALGFTTGMIVTMHAITQVKPDERWIAMIGLGESLNNLGLAFLLMLASGIAATVGAWRLARQVSSGSAATA